MTLARDPWADEPDDEKPEAPDAADLTAVAAPSKPWGDSRPTVRADCIGRPRPCPWVSCAHHAALWRVLTEGDGYHSDAGDEAVVGSIDTLRFSCTLDAADEGGLTLEDVGESFEVTRERIRQVESKALRTLAGNPHRLVALRTFSGAFDAEPLPKGPLPVRLPAPVRAPSLVTPPPTPPARIAWFGEEPDIVPTADDTDDFITTSPITEDTETMDRNTATDSTASVTSSTEGETSPCATLGCSASRSKSHHLTSEWARPFCETCRQLVHKLANKHGFPLSEKGTLAMVLREHGKTELRSRAAGGFPMVPLGPQPPPTKETPAMVSVAAAPVLPPEEDEASEEARRDARLGRAVLSMLVATDGVKVSDEGEVSFMVRVRPPAMLSDADRVVALAGGVERVRAMTTLLEDVTSMEAAAEALDLLRSGSLARVQALLSRLGARSVEDVLAAADLVTAHGGSDRVAKGMQAIALLDGLRGGR